MYYLFKQHSMQIKLIQISDLTSSLLEKKNYSIQTKLFEEKKSPHDNSIIKEDNVDIKTDLKRRFSFEYDENKKLHKNFKFISNLNSSTKGLGRYSRFVQK